MNKSKKCPVTVVIPTYNRTEMLVKTLKQILECDPSPEEIIVHVDGSDQKSENAIRICFENVKILTSSTNIGPGGGRNRSIAMATNEIVASFDDDSYPLDKDYFSRLLEVFNLYPDASIIAAAIYHQNQKIEDDIKQASWTASFVGCGCAYRRSNFLTTDGYLQLPLAYGAEEVDLAMQLHAQGQKILKTDWLRVYHDTCYQHHKRSAINAASIANIALLAYVRYPWIMWGRTFFQICNRIFYALRKQRYDGIMLGLSSIPRQLWIYRNHRKPVSFSTMQQYLSLRKKPIPVSWQ